MLYQEIKILPFEQQVPIRAISQDRPLLCVRQSHYATMSSIIETLFGRAKTPAERLRQHQRTLQKAQRELDRERSKLEQQEKKLIIDIKKSAKDGQMVRAQCLADNAPSW